eukprot:CAMPEP_0178977216 /NCGR_PEP_ID=MMETSP0789-20121207/24356_1 /TAXON_ID=3005 /ORGANISM="Rhizosolenia setigera, Strain CCMP 1694" /LENGTH=978 /DNA_ID=CAMNT_0020666571 /DNA_START=524 /DNA_END=3460 /DNA_ORIENTATION=+
MISLVLKNRGSYDVTILSDGGSSLSNTENPSGICKSVLRVVEGLCCNSEIPTLEKMLGDMDGVVKMTGISIATRTLYFEHDPFIITVKEVAKALTKEGFRSIVKRDGARQQYKQPQDEVASKEVKKPATPTANYAFWSNQESDGFGTEEGLPTVSSPSSRSVETAQYVESTLRIGKLSSLKHIKSMESAFKKANSQMRREAGKKRMVRAFHPHPDSKTIKVEHDPKFISASDLAIYLCKNAKVGAVEVVEDGFKSGRFVNIEDDGDEEEYIMRRGKNVKGNHQEDILAMEGIKTNVILSGFFWLLSVLSVIGGEWEFLEYFGLLSVLFGLPPIAKKAFRTMRRCQFDANCMMITAALGALCLQEFDEAASVSFLFALSEWLEAKATYRARVALNTIVNMRPETANVYNEETQEVKVGVPVGKVRIGTVVNVRTGDKIPCDGIVISGSTMIDESSLTGEAAPVTKSINDEVSGGTINIGHSPLLVRATSTAEDSSVSRLIRLVEEAQVNRSNTEKLVDTFAKRYTPVVLSMALGMVTIPWAWGPEVGRYWALNGLIIIVIACPCALTISTPVTYAAGLAATAQAGIIVKGGAKLEALGRVKEVVFDKTGTLTEGRFSVSNLLPLGKNTSRKKVLELLVVMESPSSHPLASTLLETAKDENISIPKGTNLQNHTILQGEGVSGVVDGKEVFVGNRRLFERLGLYQKLNESDRHLIEEWNHSGGTVGLIGYLEEGIIGAFCVNDTVREEAESVLEAMKNYGINVTMLTGDGDGAAQFVGNQVGLSKEQIKSQLIPDDKLHYIGSMKQGVPQNRWCGTWFKSPSLILMCGDGVNDAPALAVADVGVAMGSGAALAMEMSDVTLMDSNLNKLLFSIKMGKRVIWAIQENIIFSLIAKTIVVGFTFAGWMTLLSAIATDVGVMLAVTLNGMKLLPSKKRNWEKLVENDTRSRKFLSFLNSKKKYNHVNGANDLILEDSSTHEIV